MTGPWWRRRRVATALIVVALVGAVTATVAVLRPGGRPMSCNGSRSLCDRPYDEVTYLTTHNAMASAARGFSAPDQHADLVGQLDAGVRALMLDLHRWTTSAEAAPILARLSPQIRAVVTPLVRADPERPGIWLCHEICQVGADPAVQQLVIVREWLRRHPHDVVTLLLEDDVPPADVRATITAAGLDPWLATPPQVGGAWPTLGHLISSRHTLMVFTEHAHATSGPVRNLYEYAAETPFAATTVAALTCAPDRGGRTAPLFLINNWLTMTIPSPTAALRVDNARFLTDRVRRCEAERGMRATFVAVDFVDVGAPLQVVDALNAR